MAKARLDRGRGRSCKKKLYTKLSEMMMFMSQDLSVWQKSETICQSSKLAFQNSTNLRKMLLMSCHVWSETNIVSYIIFTFVTPREKLNQQQQIFKTSRPPFVAPWSKAEAKSNQQNSPNQSVHCQRWSQLQCSCL